MAWFGQAKSAMLVIASNGEVTRLVADRQSLVLDILERGGIPHPSKCRIGSCGTCVMRLVSGEIRNLTDTGYVLAPSDVERGHFLPCQARLRSDTVIVTRLLGTMTTGSTTIRGHAP